MWCLVFAAMSLFAERSMSSLVLGAVWEHKGVQVIARRRFETVAVEILVRKGILACTAKKLTSRAVAHAPWA
jgi:hypothetical protein